MSVVLRCPTCGTTQGHPGECEACSETEVRYFCTNHDEGNWLDAAVCSQCGARFGDPRRTSPPPPAAPTRPASAPDFRPPRSRRSPERPLETDFSKRRPPRPAIDEPAEPDVVPPASSLEDLLAELARASGRDHRTYEPEAVPWTRPAPPRAAFPLAGCFIRFIGMLLVLFAAGILFLFLFFGGALG
jgi:hypothetical protein